MDTHGQVIVDPETGFAFDDKLIEIANDLCERAEIIRRREDFKATVQWSQDQAPKKNHLHVDIDGTHGPRIVEFYSSSDIYGPWLSNCAKTPFFYGAIEWPSSEHFFQISKFLNVPRDDPNYLSWSLKNNQSVDILRLRSRQLVKDMLNLSPKQVAQFGRTTRAVPIRANWDNVRDFYMACAIYLKFSTNPALLVKLKETKDAILIERAPRDKYWAVDKTGKGLNKLGALLIALRETI